MKTEKQILSIIEAARSKERERLAAGDAAAAEVLNALSDLAVTIATAPEESIYYCQSIYRLYGRVKKWQQKGLAVLEAHTDYLFTMSGLYDFAENIKTAVGRRYADRIEVREQVICFNNHLHVGDDLIAVFVKLPDVFYDKRKAQEAEK